MPLFKLLLRRLLLGLVTLLLVSLLVFFATQGLPGDTAVAILGKDATPERLEALRRDLQLERPLVVQYVSWLGGVIRGDLGESLVVGRTSGALGSTDYGENEGVPVTSVIGRRVVNSAALVLVAALASVPIGIALGSVSALRRDGLFDTSVTIGSLVFVATPEFVIGVMLVLLLSTGVFNLLPAVSSVQQDVSIWRQMGQLFLPSLTLTIAVIPYIARLLRGSMVDVFESDYVLLARLKGTRERIVMQRHALPNAIAPTLQIIAMNLAWLAGGVVTVEYLFNYPGIGTALVDAVTNRDVPVIQAITLLIASLYVLFNLVADILTILVSPRMRTGLQ